MTNNTQQVDDGAQDNRLRLFQIVLQTWEYTFPQDPDPNEIQPEVGAIIELDVSEPDDPNESDPLVDVDHDIAGYQKATSAQEALKLFVESKNLSSVDQFLLGEGDGQGISLTLIATDDFEIYEE
jgi:hypothetical protein